MPCEADTGNFRDTATQYSNPHDDFQRTGCSLTILSVLILVPFMLEKDGGILSSMRWASILY